MCHIRLAHHLAVVLGLGLLNGEVTVCRGADLPAEVVPLVAVEKWDREVADVRRRGDAIEMVSPINYRIGRVFSPPVPAQPGSGFTLAAHVRTRFASTQSEYYRCWLQIECLHDQKVIQTLSSPELIGTQGTEQLLAVSAFAPAETTAVRAVLCAQNKYWAPVENQALLRDVRLLRLHGGPGQTLQLDIVKGLPSAGGDRTAALVVHGDWPDGTALAVAATRGSIAPSVLLGQDRAEMVLAYSASDVGRAEVKASVAGCEGKLQLADPYAATVTIDGATADGQETPVLIQLIHQGEMLKGRYQASIPGIFITPPWSTDVAPGSWQLRISRGPQFQRLDRTLQCSSGQTTELGSIEIRRQVDLTQSGWYGGDGDGDVYHGELMYTDVNAETAADLAQAVGLDWLGVGRWSAGSFGGPDPKTWGEARTFMSSLSHPRFLFMWTDERPKSEAGHACFIGLDRPSEEPFGWGWTGGSKRPLRNFEILQMVRASGGATFANHPLRWWMKGTRFNTNMYSSLPFDLCAAGLLDGVNINDKPDGIKLWSMLLDHGYRVAATAGADFCLDRPGGPPPGLHRMYCYCPQGMRRESLAEAVRNGQTIVSTGPMLLADLAGQPPGSTVSTAEPHRIRVQAWARSDQDGAPLQRLELWAHGRAIQTKTLDDGAQHGETIFEWTPEGDWDWVAVRCVARGGWAMTSAFYAASPDYQPPQPVHCRLTLDVSGLGAAGRKGASIETWDGVPSLVTAKKLDEVPLGGNESLDVPVSATVVVRLADGRKQELSVYDACNVAELIEKIASGAAREQPLLQWETYAEVLQRAQHATARIAF